MKATCWVRPNKIEVREVPDPTIQALGSVQAARVHLALPNQNGFFREQQKPTASVLVGVAVLVLGLAGRAPRRG